MIDQDSIRFIIQRKSHAFISTSFTPVPNTIFPTGPVHSLLRPTRRPVEDPGGAHALHRRGRERSHGAFAGDPPQPGAPDGVAGTEETGVRGGGGRGGRVAVARTKRKDGWSPSPDKGSLHIDELHRGDALEILGAWTIFEPKTFLKQVEQVQHML